MTWMQKNTQAQSQPAITCEEDFDHSDAGVGHCPPLHNASYRSNFVAVNLSKNNRTICFHLSKQYQ
jgi:hypothetical protein